MTTPSFTVDLLRMVCRSIKCLNAEKMAPFSTYLFLSASTSTSLEEGSMSLYYVPVVVPIACD